LQASMDEEGIDIVWSPLILPQLKFLQFYDSFYCSPNNNLSTKDNIIFYKTVNFSL
jgi:hypothetical protein